MTTTDNALVSDAKARKSIPLARGVLDYFPDALCEVAVLSRIGNDQHNPGQPMHWAKDKSTDHPDCILRHMIDRGRRDSAKVRHRTAVAWRALADLQIELDKERAALGVLVPSGEDYTAEQLQKLTDAGLVREGNRQMKKCRNAKAYKAIYPPRCNGGDPCDACRMKWNRRRRKVIRRTKSKA